jgi:hypothetical protein
MTVEELRREAKTLGYNIIPIVRMEKLLPCVCGCDRREHWTGQSENSHVILICAKCGRQANGRTNREARHNWNEMVRGEQDG